MCYGVTGTNDSSWQLTMHTHRNHRRLKRASSWWCLAALVLLAVTTITTAEQSERAEQQSQDQQQKEDVGVEGEEGEEGERGDREEEEVGIRSDPAEGEMASSCPSSCFCETEAGYATCVGDSQWAPPALPPGLTRVELRNFLVPELGAAQLQLLPDLRELQLNQCNLTRLLDDAFGRLPQLERLDLSENQLTRLGPAVFAGLAALHHLDLSANRLANLTRPFSQLAWLQHLNLKDNNLTTLTHDTFQGLDRVQYVNLDGNRIASVDVAAFQHLTGLAHLILSNNPLASLATLDFFGSRLQYIDVSNIGIARVPQALTQFVRDLRLAKNAIREIHRGDLDSYPYLGLLVLDDNGLQLLEEDALGRHEYLARLWLNGNSLQAVPLSLPPALRALYIEENMIEGLREGDFRGLASLEQLFLRRNHIASVADCALCDLVSLKTLDLQANRLTTLAGRVFSRLASLETLDLSQNPLLALDAAVFAGLTSVRVLQMSRVHSDDVTVPETAFDPLKGLQILEMYGSPHLVARILGSTRMLHSLRGVRELNLMHNDLKALRNDFPAFFPKLQVAKLSGNIWDCTSPSKILWMKRWMVARSPVTFYRSYSIRCSSPAYLGYKPVILLENSDFLNASTSVSPTSTTTATTTTATTTVTTTTAASTTSAPATAAPAIALNSGGETAGAHDATSADAVVRTSAPATTPMPDLAVLTRRDSNSPIIGVAPFMARPKPAAKRPPATTAASETATRAPEATAAPVASPATPAATTGGPETTTGAPEASSTAVSGATEGPAASFARSTTEAPPAARPSPAAAASEPASEAPVASTSTAPAPAPAGGPGSSPSPRGATKASSPPYWVIHNRRPPQEPARPAPRPRDGATPRKKWRRPLKDARPRAPPSETRAADAPGGVGGGGEPPPRHRAAHKKELWIFRGDGSRGLGGPPLPVGVSDGRVSDGAVVGAGVVASCVGLALLVGGLLLARGRGKAASPLWAASSSYWRQGGDDDVVMAVGVGGAGGGLVTESEGTVGVLTETHRGLNNRLYLLLQRDSSTGITPDSLPDPRALPPPPH